MSLSGTTSEIGFMSELLAKDWKGILGIIYRFNATENLEDFQNETLKCLRCFIPFHQGIFHVYQFVDGEIGLYGTPAVLGAPALYLDEFNSKYMKDDFFAIGSLVSSDEVFRDTDLFPDSERMRTDWYREIYAKQGIHYALRCQLTRSGNLMGSIDLFRQIHEDDFTERDVLVAEALACHISLKLNQFLSAEKSASPAVSVRGSLAAQFGLTARECDVILEIAGGLQDAQIAEKLCISPSTLKKHVHNLYHKLGIRNRAQLHSIVQESLRA